MRTNLRGTADRSLPATASVASGPANTSEIALTALRQKLLAPAYPAPALASKSRSTLLFACAPPAHATGHPMRPVAPSGFGALDARARNHEAPDCTTYPATYPSKIFSSVVAPMTVQVTIVAAGATTAARTVTD